MRIDAIIAEKVESGEPFFSFEFFPPRSDEATDGLFETIGRLVALDPAFVSVTYGAGGGTRDRTIGIVERIIRDLGLEAMAHLTCVNHTREELHATLRRMVDAGVGNVLALRGDPPAGEERFEPTPGGLAHASELATLVSESYDLCVGGACYPEGHLEAPSLEADLDNLRLKVAAGATFLITQLFFDNERYFGFVERARAGGIDVPIIAGIMPITNVKQIKRFTRMCGASIPLTLLEQLELHADQPDAVAQLGAAYASVQCRDLLARGAPGIHFYTLNRSPAASAVVGALRATRTPGRPHPGLRRGDPAASWATSQRGER